MMVQDFWSRKARPLPAKSLPGPLGLKEKASLPGWLGHFLGCLGWMGLPSGAEALAHGVRVWLTLFGPLRVALRSSVLYQSQTMERKELLLCPYYSCRKPCHVI